MALIAAICAGPALADEVPPQLGLLVMLKVLSYDATFEARVGDRDFLVLVPYAPNQTDAARAVAAVGLELPIKAMVGRPLKFEPVPAAELETQLVTRNAAAVIVLGGTPYELAKQQASAAARHQRYAITLDEDLVKAGIPIGVALNNGKAQLILNVTAARAIKAEFSSAVMRVARIQQ